MPASTAPPPSQPWAGSTEGRYHALDALRGFALLLGVFFHAAESFCPRRWSWAIVDRSAHALFDLFQHTCHAFRMEVFFLIAGFFAHLLIAKRGEAAFMGNRAKRIVGPLVVGWLVLYPVILYLWLTGAAMTENLGRLQIPAEFHQRPTWQLVFGMVASGQIFGRAFNWAHLWFLHQLVVLYALALGIRHALLRRGVGDGQLVRAGRRAFRWTFRPGRMVVVYAAITAPILWTMDGWGVDTPNRSLMPHLPTTMLYALFFLVGWSLFSQADLLSRWPRNWPVYIGVGAALVLATATFRGWTAWLLPARIPLPLMKALYSVLYALMMWVFVAGITGLFLRHCSGGSRFWRYVADSSYWVYLVHLPVVVALQLVVAKWNLHWSGKYLLIVGTALPLLYVSYHYFVRSTWVGVALNGRRYPRTWPWRQVSPTRC